MITFTVAFLIAWKGIKNMYVDFDRSLCIAAICNSDPMLVDYNVLLLTNERFLCGKGTCTEFQTDISKTD